MAQSLKQQNTSITDYMLRQCLLNVKGKCQNVQ